MNWLGGTTRWNTAPSRWGERDPLPLTHILGTAAPRATRPGDRYGRPNGPAAAGASYRLRPARTGWSRTGPAGADG